MMQKMRNFVLLFLLVGVLGWYGVKVTDILRNEVAVTTSADGRPTEEFYDRQNNGDAVRRIGEIPGVSAAAVLNRGEDILVGITTAENAPSDLEALVSAVIAEEFGENVNLALAVGGGAASDIMELSYYLNQGISVAASDRRFDSLFRRVWKE